MPADLLSAAEAAQHLGVSKRQVLALVKSEKLPAVRVGRQWAIRLEDLNNYRPQPVGRPKKQNDAGE